LMGFGFVAQSRCPGSGTASGLALIVGVAAIGGRYGDGRLLRNRACRKSTDATSSREEQMAIKSRDGIVSKPSKYSVPETLDRLKALLRGKGITVFKRVDHSGEAEKVGMKMPPTQLLIFGNPKAGTPVMLAAPVAAIDLPLKALAWQSADGKVWL